MHRATETKRDEFNRRVELFRCILPLAGSMLSLALEFLHIRPHLGNDWSAGDYTLFILGWSPLALAAMTSLLYVPAVSIFCPLCGKHLASKEPWICGYCGGENLSASFLKRCRRCKQAPAAIRCPWCRELIVLEPGGPTTNFAHCMREERPPSDLPAVLRQLERQAPQLRLACAAEGAKLHLLIFLDPNGSDAQIRWFAKPTVSEPLTVEGYDTRVQLFRQTGWEGSHAMPCPPGEHYIRMLLAPEGSTGKTEDVTCRLTVAPPQKPAPVAVADPIAAAIAELEQLTLPPLALDEWAIKKERELRERWAKELTEDEINGLSARFRGSMKIARAKMESLRVSPVPR